MGKREKIINAGKERESGGSRNRRGESKGWRGSGGKRVIHGKT